MRSTEMADSLRADPFTRMAVTFILLPHTIHHHHHHHHHHQHSTGSLLKKSSLFQHSRDAGATTLVNSMDAIFLGQQGR